MRKRFRKTWTRTRDVAAKLPDYLDAAIGLFAPRTGLNRRRARAAAKWWHEHAAQLSSKIAQTPNDRLHADRWLASRLSPDSDLELHLSDLRHRSQQLYGRYGRCKGAINTRVDNVVGPGIRPQSRIKEVGSLIDAGQAETYNRELEALFERLAPLVGPGGRNSLCDVQRLAERCWQRDGEAFLIFSDVGRTDKPIPLQLQVIAAERVETPPEEEGNPSVRLGIEKNAAGDVVAYHVRNAHPDDTVEPEITYTRFPAERVVHLYEQEWPDQSRGIPWFAAVLADVQDFQDFKEAVIIAAQIAACVTMIVGTTDPDNLADGAQNADGEEELQPGKILYRHISDQVHTLAPAQPATTYGMFSEVNDLALAGGLNWPYGWLTKDRRRTTFSSGKLEEIDGGVVIRCDQRLITERLLVPFWQRMVSEAVIVGATSIDPTAYARQPWLYSRVKWIGPGRPWIDPPKEVGAAVEAKEHNLLTLAEIHAKVGLDTEETLIQRGREIEWEEQHGCVPPIKNGLVPLEPLEETADEEEEAFA